MPVRYFTMKHDFENQRVGSKFESPEESHFGFTWRTQAEYNNNGFFLRLLCSKATCTADYWLIEFNATFTVEVPGNPLRHKKITASKEKGGSDDDSTLECFPLRVMSNKFSVILSVDITKNKEEARISFDAPVTGMTDVVLKVEDRDFHVSKVILANFSPVFKSMFFANFKESDDGEVCIKEAEPDAFGVFLSIIYNAHGKITDHNVRDLLKLADRYCVRRVLGKCSKYLMATKTMEVWKRIRLADQANLLEAVEAIINSLKSGREVKNVCSWLSEDTTITPYTTVALLKKSVSFH